MRTKSSLLAKMADRILKATDKADALNRSKEKSDKLKRLHEAISDRYKFKISRHDDATDIECDVKFLKLIERTLSPTWSQENKLEMLFKKYNVK